MKKFFCLSMLVVLSAINSSFALNQEKTYSFGVVPQFEAKKLHAIWEPILTYLKNETGYRFILRGSPTIPEFETQFIQGEFDFAYMNPYHLAVANEKAGYQPILRDHGRKLYGILVVRKDSNITSPSQLNGKALAFPAQNALGASLQIRQELIDTFNIDFLPKYVKTHDSVYLNVLLGRAAAGGGVQKTLQQQRPEVREALQVIHQTQKVTPHPIAVLPSVPEEVKNAVTAALIKYGQTDEGRSQLAKVPIKEIGRADLADYLPLIKLGLERFYKQP